MRIYDNIRFIQTEPQGKQTSASLKKRASTPNFSGTTKEALLSLRKETIFSKFYEIGLDKNFVIKNIKKLTELPFRKFITFLDAVNKYQQIPSNKVSDLNEIFRDRFVDIESYTKLIQRLSDEKIDSMYLKQIVNIGREAKYKNYGIINTQPAYFMNVYTPTITYGYNENEDTTVLRKEQDVITDFDKINKFLDFRLEAIAKKSLLDKYNKKATNSDVDEILLTNPSQTETALNIIGKEAFLYSFKEKKDNVIEFIESLGRFCEDKYLVEKVKLLTRPRETEYYQNLEREITQLKSRFHLVKTEAELEELKKEINTKTKEKYQIIKDSIKDPKDILEKALILANLYKTHNSDEILEVLELLKENNSSYKERLEQMLFSIYNLEVPDNETLKKLDFKKTKYFPKLFAPTAQFKDAFKKLVNVIAAHPEKTTSEIFDNLEYNKETKRIFEEELGVSYEKWCEHDPTSALIFSNRPNNKIKVQKADMNNIAKSLFLGDDSACCTKINGSQAQSAVSYILSKMVQCIEVYHNNMPIGNAMCYLALVDSKLSLILDNIEVKKQYSNDNLIRDSIFAYAKQMVEELGLPDMPVYLCGKRHDIKTDGLREGLYNLKIMGNSGYNLIYIDAKTNSFQINDNSREISCAKLYSITPSCSAPLNNSLDSEIRAQGPNDRDLYYFDTDELSYPTDTSIPGWYRYK